MKSVLLSVPAIDTIYIQRCLVDARRREEAMFSFDVLRAGFHDTPVDESVYLSMYPTLSVQTIAAKFDAWAFYLDRGVTETMLEDVNDAVAAGFRPEYEPADICPSVNPPYEKRISFRVFRDGHDKDLSLDLRLRDCARWPLLLAKFEQHARREWDLPR